MRVLRRLLGKSDAAQKALIKPTKLVQDDTQSNQSQADVDIQYQIDLAKTLAPELLVKDLLDNTAELTQASTTTDEERRQERRQRRERKASKRSQSRDNKPLKTKRNVVVKKENKKNTTKKDAIKKDVKKNATKKVAVVKKEAVKKETRKQFLSKAEQEEQKLTVTTTPKDEVEEAVEDAVVDKQEDLEDDHHLELLPAVRPPEYIYLTIEQDENDDAWRCEV